ncbi:unnamed protein product [Caenorhabditis bovis]|uniref:GYF domain-containing protein n=1 Tax=Caenorhabditis bovis TaxID=2654633 RepID=A0A8S1EPU6_9PELO|nr:unnamed protein product [Caenorhabditis bovis]
MPKRAVSFADDIEYRSFKRDRRELENLEKDENFDLPMEEGDEPVKNRPDNNEEEEPKEKFHTLESDEEEEEDHKRLDVNKVEGQEDSTMDFDGTIKITAFNMKEDMEDGHFDETGNFIFDKKEKEIQDAWLDGIDWSTVKKKAGDQWEGDDKKEESDDFAPPVMSDLRKKEILEALSKILKPNQTIAKALTELKKKKGLTAAEERKMRWAAKKAGKTFEQTDGQKETAELSGLADELISAGFMDAYEWHKEKIEFMLQKMNKTAVDDLDMFSDEPVQSSSKPSTENVGMDDEEVKWEYKENDEPGTKVQGPFTSSEMADKQQKGELASKGVARRLNTPGSFNPVARIDFDLYC